MGAVRVCRWVSLLVSSLTLAALVLPAAAGATPGALDPSFGTGGIVLSSAPGFQSLGAEAVAIQSDGKIVAGGTGLLDSPADPAWFIARLNSDGTLDTSFNSTGYATLSWPNDICCADLRSLTVTSDGEILAAGTAQDPATGDSALAVARFNANGTLDTAFGTNGVVMLGIAGMETTGKAMAVQLGQSGDVADIVVGGTACKITNDNDCQFVVARFLANGRPDLSFNSTGYLESSFGTNSDDALSGISIDSSGNIFISGAASPTEQETQVVLAELNSSGSLDASFGNAGVELASHGAIFEAGGLALTSGGDLVTAGSSCVSLSSCASGPLNCALSSCASLAAFSSATGAPDDNFGAGGVTIGPPALGFATAVAVAPDGTIISIGYTVNLANYMSGFAIQRYTSAGQIDSTYGNDGLSILQDTCSSYDYASAVAIQPNGDAVVAGSSSTSGTADELMLARFEGGAGTAGTAGCGPPTLATPPTATILTPHTGQTYTPGQQAATSFSCAEGSAYGPGISECTDVNLDNTLNGSISSAGTLDTYPIGPHTYTVTALSKDGLTGTASIDYLVADPPTVKITAPGPSLSIPYGAKITASYSCADGTGGTGIATCSGTVPSGSPIPTTPAGTHYLTVTATSTDGLSTTERLHYRVLFPQSLFTVSDIRTSADGKFRFRVNVPGPGTIDVMETAWDTDRAFAAALLQPAPDRFVFARGHFVAADRGAINATVPPNAAGRELVKHHRYRIVLRLWVTFTPVNGRPRSIGTYGLHL
jgi:uncharacterized delta-60 repeat protein